MADNDEHSKDEHEEPSVGQKIMAAAVKEMGFAVDSIRQEVVEKGWYGEKVTPLHTIANDSPEIGPSPEPEQTQSEFSWGDLYGRDPDGPEPEHEHDLDQDLER